MNDAVPPFFNNPVLIRTGLNMAFTSIAVDGQVATPDGSTFDVIFVGTSTGQLLKAVNCLSPKSVTNTRTVIIEELEVAASLIKSITVVRTAKGSGHVLVATRDTIRSLPLYRCEKARSCAECVALQDPYCAWDVREEQCRGSQAWQLGTSGAFLSAVAAGRHAGCRGELPPTAPAAGHRAKMGTVINEVAAGAEGEPGGGVEKRGGGAGQGGLSRPDQPTIEASVVLFSLETLIITVSAGAVAALVVGFVTGGGRHSIRLQASKPLRSSKQYVGGSIMEAN